MEYVSLILGFLGPLLMKCQQGVSSEDPREYLKAHYDSANDSFDGGVVRDALPQTLRAQRLARRSLPPRDRRNFPRYSRSESVQQTVDALKDFMNADDQRVAACQAEAANIPEDDE